MSVTSPSPGEDGGLQEGVHTRVRVNSVGLCTFVWSTFLLLFVLWTPPSSDTGTVPDKLHGVRSLPFGTDRVRTGTPLRVTSAGQDYGGDSVRGS